MYLMGRKIIVLIIVISLVMTFVSIPHFVTSSLNNNARNTASMDKSLEDSGGYKPLSEQYVVNFTESGLPADTVWSVNLSGKILFNYEVVGALVYHNYINFSEPDGTYDFQVSAYQTPMSYLYPSPSNGTVTVSGKNVTININYFPGPVNAWSFKGAYANYSLSQYTSNGTEYGSSSIYVSSLNLLYGFYNATFTKNIGTLHVTQREIGIEGIWPSIFQLPVLFILTYSTLSGMQQGNISSTRLIISQMENPHSNFIVGNVSLKTGVSLNTPIGTFLSDEISANYEYSNTTLVPDEGFHLFYDQYSGVLLEYQFGNGNLTEMLKSTNIPMSSSGSTFIIHITPDNAKIALDGVNLNVTSGNASAYINPGTGKLVFVSVSANGYVPVLKGYILGPSASRVYVNISLEEAQSNTYTVSGYIDPVNSNVFVGQYAASVNSTGYYSISLPGGSYVLSASDYGYFPTSQKITLNANLTDLNLSLPREPSPTSTISTNNLTATGYNVTVSNLRVGSGNISMTYSATRNGSLTVEIPYSNLGRYNISDLLNSTLYVNGSVYTNFTVAVSSNVSGYSIILVVNGLSGDPVLLWIFSPSTGSPGLFPGLSNIDLEIIGAVVIIALIAGVTLSVSRRRNK